jgi:hypothetical protein
MGEVERAQALLQAAGVSGVKVQEQAEMVTMSRAEADALRAGAAPPVAGAQAPAGVPPQVQALAAQVAAAGAPGQLTKPELDGMDQAQLVAYMDRPGGDDEVNRVLREGA